MKKLVALILVAFFVSNVSFGQKAKKPNINKALKMLQAGDIAAAKNEIDRASEYEKLKDNGKTWYYRGLVYVAIDTTSNAEINSLEPNAVQVAMESFQKANALNKSNSDYTITVAGSVIPEYMSAQVETFWGVHLNKGVKHFQDGDSEKAVSEFEKCQMIKENDTTSYYYGGLAAHNAQMYDKAIVYYEKYLDNGGNESAEEVYGYLVSIKSNANKDSDAALSTLEKAIAAFPNNTEFPKQQINIYIQADRIDEAKAKLEAAIKKEPENANLYFTLGVMYDELGEIENAKTAYKQAIEKDANYYNAIFNVAVLYYNEAVEISKQKNALGITSADLKKAKELEKTMAEKMQIALPFWEKARSIKPNERTTLETLQFIYSQLKMEDKAEEVYNAIQGLEG